jgi:putative transposase
MAYSSDLRKRVLSFVDDGNSKEEAAERYDVSVSTVYLWCRTPKKTKASKPGPKGCWKLDLERLQALVTERPTAYQAELASPLGVCQYTVCCGLRKLNLTRKKNGYVFRE